MIIERGLFVDGTPSFCSVASTVGDHVQLSAPYRRAIANNGAFDLAGEIGEDIGNTRHRAYVFLQTISCHIPLLAPLRFAVINGGLKLGLDIFRDTGGCSNKICKAFSARVDAIFDHIVFGSPFSGTLGFYLFFIIVERDGGDGKQCCGQGSKCNFHDVVLIEPLSLINAPITISVNPRQQKTVVGIGSPNECERVGPAQFAWVFAVPARKAGPMVTRGGRSSGLPSSLAFSGLPTRRCVATRLEAGRHVHLNARRPRMSANNPQFLSLTQIRRLLRVITRLPQGPRRERYFRYLMRSNAPAVIFAVCGPDLGVRDV